MMMKNKFLNILVSVCLLSCCAFATEPESVVPETQNQAMTETMQTESDIEGLNDNIQESVPEEDVSTQTPDILQNVYKKPLSKRKIAKKFLLAMSGVAISSFLIFFIFHFK